jgi:lipopolysaccharide transport system ATP-binding protein
MSMSSEDICVAARGVSKKFSRSLKRSFVYGARDIGRLLLGQPGQESLRPSEFWAIRDVSLELRRGQSIGIVGLNGSGKTTLLRMISGILRPTLGEININGRIAPMLALGAGFKPVLSGRENIFLNLSLLGVAEQAIRDRFDSIVDFAELSESIEAPIGTYSSGMLARLGFACAVHTDPKILVVDEVLSVGDARFRMKCRNRINELRRSGTSMLLVSHSAIMIETLSDECIFLRKGKVAAQGAPAEVLREYEADGVAVALSQNMQVAQARAERTAAHEHLVGISSIDLATEGGADGFWVCGMGGEMIVTLKTSAPTCEVSVNLMIFDLTHQPGETVLFMMSSRDLGRLQLEAGQSQVRLVLPHVGLRPGTYRVKVSVSRGEKHDLLDVVDGVRLVVRDAGRASNSLYYQPRDWICTGGAFDGFAEASSEPEEVDVAEG